MEVAEGLGGREGGGRGRPDVDATLRRVDERGFGGLNEFKRRDKSGLNRYVGPAGVGKG